MRIVATVMMTLALCSSASAASAYWKNFDVRTWGESYGANTTEYGIYGVVYGEHGGHAEFHTSIVAHEESDGLHLKQFDFSKEMLEPTFNWWALAVYGDIVSETTFASLDPIELFRYDGFDSGGTLVENPSDFYMAFKVSEVLIVDAHYEEGMTWYGWAHVSIDDSMEMTLLDAGINLYGGEVIVGATPEPSAGVLFLLGAAALGLRRRGNCRIVQL